MNSHIKTWINMKENDKRETILQELRGISIDDTDDKLMAYYTKSVSISQSRKCKNGKEFEAIIEEHLSKEDIPFKSQVAIDSDGIIIGLGTTVTNHAHTIDIVIGDNIRNGCSIREFIVLSCKTSVRERWNQDDWTYTHPPLVYILCTISDDYSQPKKFKESSKRKIVTLKPKKKDLRTYKLDFDQMMIELNVYVILNEMLNET